MPQTVVDQGQLVVARGAAVHGDLVIGTSGHSTNNGDMSNLGDFSNAGIFTGSSQVSGSFCNGPTGAVRITGGQTLFLQNASPQGNSEFISAIGTQSAPATFESAGPFTNSAGGAVCGIFEPTRLVTLWK